MTYIDGFVAPVLQENKQAYLHHAHEALSLGRPKWSQLPSSCLTRRWREQDSNPRSLGPTPPYSMLLNAP
jgi:hypothetical protein